jgi:uncharacterized protein
MNKIILLFTLLVTCIVLTSETAPLHAQTNTPASETEFDWNSPERLRLECDTGVIKSCQTLSDYYSSGIGVVSNNQKSLQYLSKACIAGEINNCLQVANVHDIGRWRTFESNPTLAIPYYRTACDAGRVEGCSALSYMYRVGRGVSPDVVESDKFGAKSAVLQAAVLINYLKECDANDGLSCLSASHLLVPSYILNSDKSASKDTNKAIMLQQKAFSLLEKDCNSDESKNCLRFARMYLFGEGIKKNQSEFKRFAIKACNAGNSEACYAINHGYVGDGSITNFEEQCSYNNMSACFMLGTISKKDKKRSKSLFKKVCDNGYVYPCYRYGMALIDRKDPDRDTALGRVILARTCRVGLTEACKAMSKLNAKPE